MDQIDTSLSELRASVRPIDADALALRTGWRPGGNVATTTRRPRTRGLLITTGAVLAAGATAVTLVVTSDRATNGRPFMLAAAAKVEHAPQAGKCWYERSYWFFGGDLKGPVRLGPATPGPGASQMLEAWTCRGAGVRTMITYPAGKGGKTVTNNYPASFARPFKLKTGQVLTGVSDSAGMERLIRAAYAKEDRRHGWWPKFPSFEEYVWSITRDAVTTDLPPRAKAALYRVLAAQQGITNLGERKDQIGRTGVAISMRMPQGPKSDGNGLGVMLFDRATGDFMAELTGQQTVVEKMGWVAHKGDRLW